jgi:acetylornithine/N-succinyldiaminopimelate aminotransferase
MFAWQKYGVKPDVMTTAKALGNGVPIGAFLASGKAATAMEPGDHGTTYGGNPFVTAAAAKVLELFETRNIVEHVKEIGEYLWDKIEELASKYPVITEHRGAGLIQGIEFSIPVAPIVEKAIFQEKLVIISAGANVIRLVPPLVIEKEHVDDMILKLESVLKV